MRPLVAVFVLLAVAGCGVRPSGVIMGVDAPDGPVKGTVLFLVSAGRPTAVVRPTTVDESTAPGSPPSRRRSEAISRRRSEAIALLAAGPTEQERAQDLTSEVPPDAAPADVSNTMSGVTVTLSTNVSELSIVAIEQIACTAAAEHPVTVEGEGRRRGPVTCPV